MSAILGKEPGCAVNKPQNPRKFRRECYMKLCTFEFDKKIRVGAELPDGKIMDVNYAYAAKLKADGHPKPQGIADVITPPDMIELIKSEDLGIKAIQEAMEYLKYSKAESDETLVFDAEDIKFKAPITNPSKICAVVLNSRKFMDTAEKPANPRPLYFFKPNSALCGPFDDIELADIGTVASEAEICFVFNKKCKYVDAKDAMKYVYGYMAHNDIPATGISKSIEWVTPKGGTPRNYTGRSKCQDTFSPMGPWLVTADEIDPNNVSIDAYCGDIMIQSGDTSEMYFRIPEVIEWLTSGHTWYPGDIVSWGTVGTPVGAKFETIDIRAWGGPLITDVKGIGRMVNPIKKI